MAKKENQEVTEVQETALETKETKTTEKVSKKEKANKKAVKADKAPKKNRVKETLGELKKVTWPSFGKTMKQTGMVLSLVLVFGVLVLGFDLLISLIINLLSSF